MFSVVMSTYNGKRHLGEQIESLAKQTLPPAELIVADDGSNDGTIELLQEIGARLPFRFRLIQNPSNLGYGESFLNAAQQAQEPYICWCDQDDVWDAEKLKVIADQIADHPGASLYVHSSTVVDEELNDLGAAIPLIPKAQFMQPGTANPLRWPPGFVMTFRRDLLTRYDWRTRPSDFFAAGEPSKHDTWIYALADADAGIRLTPEKLALYRRHGANASYYRPGSNFARRVSQIRDLFQPPSVKGMQTHLCAFREHADYFETCARNAATPADAERLTQVAQKYRRGQDLLESRLAIHASPYGKKSKALARAVARGLYVQGSRVNRGMLLQDSLSLTRLHGS